MIPMAFDEAGIPIFARPSWCIRLFGGLDVEGQGRQRTALARQPRTGALLAFPALHPFDPFRSEGRSCSSTEMPIASSQAFRAGA